MSKRVACTVVKLKLRILLKYQMQEKRISGRREKADSISKVRFPPFLLNKMVAIKSHKVKRTSQLATKEVAIRGGGAFDKLLGKTKMNSRPA